MKKLFLLLLTCFGSYLSFATQPPIQTIIVKKSLQRIPFQLKTANSPKKVLLQFDIDVEYWSSSDSNNIEKAIDLDIINQSSCSPTLNMETQHIKAAEFKTNHQTQKITVFITIETQASFVSNQFFYIGIKGFTITDSFATIEVVEKLAAPVLSSQYINITTKNASIQYYQKAENQNSKIVRQIKLVVDLWSSSNENLQDKTLQFEIDGNTAQKATLNVNSYLIKSTEFSTTPKTIEIYLGVTINEQDKFKEIDTLKLTITGSSTNPSIVKIATTENNPNAKDETKWSSSNEVWVELGGNIDLVDGKNTGNLAGGVFLHLKDKCFFGNKNKFSIQAGIYETKSTANSNLGVLGYNKYLTSNSYNTTKKDTAKVYGYYSTLKPSQTIRTWSVFASPQYKFGNTRLNDGKVHLLAALWLEFQKQEINFNYDNSKNKLVDSLEINKVNIIDYNEIDTSVQQISLSTHYIGIGSPMYYESKDIQFLLNPYIGISNQPTPQELKNSFNGQYCWRPFYVVQFRLTEYHLGITCTGEIRGLFKKLAPAYFTFALTKKFNLSKFLNYGDASTHSNP